MTELRSLQIPAPQDPFGNRSHAKFTGNHQRMIMKRYRLLAIAILSAIRQHVCPCDQSSHLFNSESGGLTLLQGVLKMRFGEVVPGHPRRDNPPHFLDAFIAERLDYDAYFRYRIVMKLCRPGAAVNRRDHSQDIMGVRRSFRYFGLGRFLNFRHYFGHALHQNSRPHGEYAGTSRVSDPTGVV